LLRLLLPLCLLGATSIAVAGLFRVVGQPTASSVSQQSTSLKLGTAGADANAVPLAVGGRSTPPSSEPASPTHAPAAAATAQPVTKPVVVMNASGISGLAGRTADLLRERGVSVTAIGNLSTTDNAQRPLMRTVFYPPGGRGQAQTLAVLSDAPAVVPAPGWLQPAGKLVLVLTAATGP
jgi:LytR cell envelope-related transcriptional attenuator